MKEKKEIGPPVGDGGHDGNHKDKDTADVGRFFMNLPAKEIIIIKAELEIDWSRVLPEVEGANI